VFRGSILLEYGALSSEPTPFPLFTVLGKSLTLKGYLYVEIVNDDGHWTEQSHLSPSDLLRVN
jgi:hypothetical protein